MFSPLTLLFRGWRATLLFVAVAGATPGRATAECGDHVTVLNARADPTEHAAPTPTGAPAPPQAPRHGPKCSRRPDRHAPPFAPVPGFEPTDKELTQVLGLRDPTDAAPSARVASLVSLRPVARAPSIFHPPRTG